MIISKGIFILIAFTCFSCVNGSGNYKTTKQSLYNSNEFKKYSASNEIDDQHNWQSFGKVPIIDPDRSLKNAIQLALEKSRGMNHLNALSSNENDDVDNDYSGSSSENRINNLSEDSGESLSSNFEPKNHVDVIRGDLNGPKISSMADTNIPLETKSSQSLYQQNIKSNDFPSSSSPISGVRSQSYYQHPQATYKSSSNFCKGEIFIHRPPPVIVRRPPTQVLINHPPIYVRPAPVVFHRPPSMVMRPVIVKHEPRPVKVQPVYVKVIKPKQKKYFIQEKKLNCNHLMKDNNCSCNRKGCHLKTASNSNDLHRIAN